MSLAPFARDDAPRIWSVTELTRRLQTLLANVGRVAVRGEVLSVKAQNSGHIYFAIKDLDAKLECKLWKSRVATALRFELKPGMAVVVHGTLDVYAPHGSYSLICQRIEQEGLGALLAKLEELKAELKERGWFDRKRPLPAMPRLLGVATSRDGAALQDFLRTRSLRWPLYPVLLAHTPVQGAGAAAEIARAIARLDAAGVDAIALIRGGGSLEDLWAFNELPVAQAIWESRAPVVTGVGHEVDVTLADLVADWRAHTPTDAAQTLIPDRATLMERLERAANLMVQALDELFSERERRLSEAARSRALCDPLWILEHRAQALEHLGRRIAGGVGRAFAGADARVAAAHRRLDAQSPRARLERSERRLQGAALRLEPAMQRKLAARESGLAVAGAQLDALSPLKILGRGYSITTSADGAAVRDAAALQPGERIETRLARGRVISVVESARAAEPDA